MALSESLDERRSNHTRTFGRHGSDVSGMIQPFPSVGVGLPEWRNSYLCCGACRRSRDTLCVSFCVYGAKTSSPVFLSLARLLFLSLLLSMGTNSPCLPSCTVPHVRVAAGTDLPASERNEAMDHWTTRRHERGLPYNEMITVLNNNFPAIKNTLSVHA